MSVRKLSIALDGPIAEGAADAAAERAPLLEAGLAAVRDWESEYGELSIEELAWADDVLGTTTGRGSV